MPIPQVKQLRLHNILLLHFVSCLKLRLIEREHLENIKALKVGSYIHRFLCCGNKRVMPI